MDDLSYRVRGTYLESCNCEAICPCRMVDGVRGGRSTYGVCFGVLTWQIEEGHAGELDLEGLAAALVYRYDDDEPGSPWTLVLHVDVRGDERQQAALASIFLGERDGTHVSSLPWIRKARHLIGVRASPIEADGGRVRVGGAVSLSASRPFETDSTVACVVPGYDRPGRELVADELTVDDDPFAWELSGTCAYTASFDYEST